MRSEPRGASRARQASAAITALGVLAALLTVLAPTAQAAASLPQGFADETVWSGLTNPVNIEFAPDGTVFVAEKGGEIKVFDSISDTTPSAFGTGLAPAGTKAHQPPSRRGAPHQYPLAAAAGARR